MEYMEESMNDMDGYSIFVESTEDMGLVYENYKHLPDVIKSFLKEIDDNIKILLTTPDSKVIDISKDITKFKEDIQIKGKPEEIYKDEIDVYKKNLKKIRTSVDEILNTLIKLKNKIAFGGNYFRGILKKPKVYSKDIDSNKYEVISNNVRNINRAFDWVEKITIDLYNLIDQDSNILMIIDRIYIKKRIYESKEDKSTQDFKYIFESVDNTNTNMIRDNFIYIEAYMYARQAHEDDIRYLTESIEIVEPTGDTSDDKNTNLKDELKNPQPIKEDPKKEESENKEPADEEPKKEEPKKEESLPKQTDANEKNANGVKRKELYIEFIKYAKTIHSNNLFGSVFDKDAFELYNFVPHEMRYFYRLANPLLCVLNDSLAFFALSELKKINADNKDIDKLLIFAADKSNKLIVFNKSDKKVYEAENKDRTVICSSEVATTFDLYIQSFVSVKILGESFIDDSYDGINIMYRGV